MPLNNGRISNIAKPSWLKETPSPAPEAAATTAAPPKRTWQRKTSTPDSKKEDSPAATPIIEKSEAPAKTPVSRIAVKKDTTDGPKKEVTAKLQSREIKVPLKVEKTITPQSILKKPVVEKKVVESKPPVPQPAAASKSPASKSQSTTPSKSPTPSKTPPPYTGKISSKSPSKTPERFTEESSEEEDDEDEEEDEEEEEETESETESDSDDDEIDSDLDFSDDEPYRPPSPVNSKQKLIIPALKKVKKSPEAENEKRSKSPEFSFRKPELKKVITRQKSDARERSPSPEEPKFLKAKLRKVPSSLRAKDFRTREKLPVVELKKVPTKQKIDIDTKKSTDQFPLKPSILRAESNKRIPAPPPPPPPPPPPGLQPPPDFDKKPLTHKRREYIEKLKSRPRRRPDWSEMMKEVESGRKLRHVQCNDRSSPIITCKSMTKVQGQYVFETEKKNTALDKLLTEIQTGVKLRPTKTNDRSRPILDGLRKFRRQMTIEEQILKSESKAVLNTEDVAAALPEDVPDEYDDIDKVRDDLQSTKQMLALELRNKEAQERENKRLLAKIANLEAELERERARLSGGGGGGRGDSCCSEQPVVTNGGSDEVLIKNLKREVEDSQKTAKLLEKKYHDVAEQLDNAQKEIEEQKRLLARLQGGDFESRRQSEAQQKESSPEMELVLSEEEEDESEEKKAERAARRLKREVDMLKAKLNRLKEKETNARNERKSLRDAMKKNQQVLKDEKKKFKKLQKEVEKMAAMMKAVEDECSDDEAEEKEEPEEEDEEEEESEAESEESESESDSDTESQSEDEDAEDQRKKDNLEPRVKRHDGRFSSLKKGNYLLAANVERLKDEIKDHKEKCSALQADLDSVIDLC